MVVILMGVSGAGKSTIGQALAQAWRQPFYDGDAFHPPENVAKMAANLPLNDIDREPWLMELRRVIDRYLADGNSAIFAISALKAVYRQLLGTERPEILLVYLQGSYDLILERMIQRSHFMPPALLQSQFDTLEAPNADLVLNVAQPVAVNVLKIMTILSRMDANAAV